MRILPWEPEPDEEHRRTKESLEVADDGDRASFAGDHRCATERGRQRARSRIIERAGKIGAPGAATVECSHLDRDACGCDRAHVRLEQVLDPIRILVGHEPATHLRHRDTGEHGLRSLAGVAREHPVHFAGGARPELLERGVPRFAAERGDAKMLPEPGLVEWELLHRGANGVGKGTHLVVEAGDRDSARRIVEGRDDPGERRRGIHHSAAVHPRVQIGVGTGDVELEVGQPAERREDARDPGREHRRVGDHHRVAGEALLVLLDEGREMFGAHLFLALDDNDDVHRERAARGEMRLECGDVEPELAFVVNTAARIDVAVADGGLECWRGPEFEGFRRLHVVVPVHDHGRRACWRLAPLGEHHRMPRRGKCLGSKADAREVAVKPGRGGGDVVPVLGACTHTRDAQELEEVVVQPLVVLCEPACERGVERGGGSHRRGSVESAGQVPDHPVSTQRRRRPTSVAPRRSGMNGPAVIDAK